MKAADQKRTMTVSPKFDGNLTPVSEMDAGRQVAAARVDRWKHDTTISLCIRLSTALTALGRLRVLRGARASGERRAGNGHDAEADRKCLDIAQSAIDGDGSHDGTDRALEDQDSSALHDLDGSEKGAKIAGRSGRL